MIDRPFAESTARNAAPILEILQREFRNSTRVLEIGSGTGQHAVMFAAAVSGYGTLSLEVLYTRLLSQRSHASVYSFALMLLDIFLQSHALYFCRCRER